MKPRRFVKMFKPQFAPLVKAGTKRQTIRPTPKRMPQSGDVIDCREWTGAPYRSPQRRLIEAPIVSVLLVRITSEAVITESYEVVSWMNKPRGMRDEFARADGFDSFEQMVQWFKKEHGLPFTGILIKWAPPGDRKGAA